MTLSQPPRGGRKRRLRPATHIAAGTLGVTLTFTALWAAPAASASASAPHPRTHARAHTRTRAHTHARSKPHGPAPSSRRGWLKYYIVQPPRHGQKEFLFEIAAKTLGNGNLATEIFKLNKGRLQPGGSRLETPTAIQPGWILVLPAKASGPGVHYGLLPVVTPPPAPSASASPSPSASASPAPPASRHKPLRAAGAKKRSWPLPVSQRTVIGVGASLLVILLAAGLVRVFRRRRKAAATSKPGGQPRTRPVPGLQAGTPTGMSTGLMSPELDDAGDLLWPDYLTQGVAQTKPENAKL